VLGIYPLISDDLLYGPKGKELKYPLADARGSVVLPDSKIVPKNKKFQRSTTNSANGTRANFEPLQALHLSRQFAFAANSACRFVLFVSFVAKFFLLGGSLLQYLSAEPDHDEIYRYFAICLRNCPARQMQEAGATGNLHDHDGQAFYLCVVDQAGQLLEIDFLPFVQLWAGDGQCLAFQVCLMKTAQSEGDAVGSQEQIGPLKMRSLRRNEMKLDRPVG
jgi:hypothetical protein